MHESVCARTYVLACVPVCVLVCMCMPVCLGLRACVCMPVCVGFRACVCMSVCVRTCVRLLECVNTILTCVM